MATVTFPKSVTLLSNVTAANGVPSGASAGVSLADFGPMRSGSTLRLIAKNNGGSGAISFTLRLWLYESVLGIWAPAGVGADSTKGTLDAGTSMGETDTDVVQHTEVIANVDGYSRAYCEVVAIAGGGGVDAYLVKPS